VCILRYPFSLAALCLRLPRRRRRRRGDGGGGEERRGEAGAAIESLSPILYAL